jgi:hypothetical protein
MTFYITHSNDRCAICWQEMGGNVFTQLSNWAYGRKIVAHLNLQNNQLVHPYHLDCLEKWALQEKTCPYCRLKFEEISGNGWNETRTTKILKKLKVIYLNPYALPLVIGGLGAAIAATCKLIITLQKTNLSLPPEVYLLEVTLLFIPFIGPLLIYKINH